VSRLQNYFGDRIFVSSAHRGFGSEDFFKDSLKGILGILVNCFNQALLKFLNWAWVKDFVIVGIQTPFNTSLFNSFPFRF
jgi:hypothetical protein